MNRDNERTMHFSLRILFVWMFAIASMLGLLVWIDLLAAFPIVAYIALSCLAAIRGWQGIY